MERRRSVDQGTRSSGAPALSVVVPNYNGRPWLGRCLDSLAAQTFPFAEVIVVDDGSEDGSDAYLRERYEGRDDRFRLVASPRNRGFAAAVNLGLSTATGDYVFVLNNDTEVRDGCLSALVDLLQASGDDVAAVQARMLRMESPDRLDDAGDVLFWTFAAAKTGHGEPSSAYAERREIFSPCAGATLYRRSFLEELGGFDERFFAYFEDVDLGFRGRLRGFRYLYEPSAEVLHQGQGSALARARYVRLMTRNRLLLVIKNVPLRLLIRRLPSILHGQLWFLRAYARWADSLAGYGSFLLTLPHALLERRRIQATRRVALEDLDRMLLRGLPR